MSLIEEKEKQIRAPEQHGDVRAYAKLQGSNFAYFMQTLSITLGRYTAAVGNERTVDVDLGDSMTISRIHARIEYDNTQGTFMLHSEGKNGLYVNGAFIAPRESSPLASRDVIEIGDVSFFFLLPTGNISRTVGPVANAPTLLMKQYSDRPPSPSNLITRPNSQLPTRLQSGATSPAHDKPPPAFGKQFSQALTDKLACVSNKERRRPTPLSLHTTTTSAPMQADNQRQEQQQQQQQEDERLQHGAAVGGLGLVVGQHSREEKKKSTDGEENEEGLVELVIVGISKGAKLCGCLRFNGLDEVDVGNNCSILVCENKFCNNFSLWHHGGDDSVCSRLGHVVDKGTDLHECKTKTSDSTRTASNRAGHQQCANKPNSIQ
eukprot:m.97887 g.97887  ORF g.97887 m.97887 type:complete len:377 (+) comp12505_c2_seq14:327-1457(+)